MTVDAATAGRGPRILAAAGPRVIYLGGLGRSGTTLLERLLGQLPGVCPVGELVHLWQRGIVAGERCGCGEPFSACEFWRKVGAAAFGGWDRVDVDRVASLRARLDRTRGIPALASPLPRATLRRPLDEYLSYYLRVYRAIVEVSGCEVIVDSSKHASLAFCLRRGQGLDLRVVHVVRDSRAVAFSWAKQVSRPDSAHPDSAHPDRAHPDRAAASHMTIYSPAVAAAQWNAQNGALALLAATSTPTLRIRYEDLADAPDRALAGIARFAGLPAGPVRPQFLGSDSGGYWADLAAAHTASGNPMRFAVGRIPIRRDDQWRTAMPAAHRRAVTALTLPLLARYGYLGRAR